MMFSSLGESERSCLNGMNVLEDDVITYSLRKSNSIEMSSVNVDSRARDAQVIALLYGDLIHSTR